MENCCKQSIQAVLPGYTSIITMLVGFLAVVLIKAAPKVGPSTFLLISIGMLSLVLFLRTIAVSRYVYGYRQTRSGLQRSLGIALGWSLFALLIPYFILGGNLLFDVWIFIVILWVAFMLWPTVIHFVLSRLT